MWLVRAWSSQTRFCHRFLLVARRMTCNCMKNHWKFCINFTKALLSLNQRLIFPDPLYYGDLTNLSKPRIISKLWDDSLNKLEDSSIPTENRAPVIDIPNPRDSEMFPSIDSDREFLKEIQNRDKPTTELSN